VIASLGHLAKEGKCDLMYFDEAGFSPNPTLPYGWARIGQTRCVEPQSHRERVNVLGALHQNGRLDWTMLQRATVREDVMTFFENLANQPYCVPRIVILDNAAIHKGDIMEEQRQSWAKKGLYLYYLPPYSPELNRIEILWKQAKYFWRRFVSLKGADLRNEIQSLMKGFGTEFTINFA
jgi:transposase